MRILNDDIFIRRHIKIILTHTYKEKEYIYTNTRTCINDRKPDRNKNHGNCRPEVLL